MSANLCCLSLFVCVCVCAECACAGHNSVMPGKSKSWLGMRVCRTRTRIFNLKLRFFSHHFFLCLLPSKRAVVRAGGIWEVGWGREQSIHCLAELI